MSRDPRRTGFRALAPWLVLAAAWPGGVEGQGCEAPRRCAPPAPPAALEPLFPSPEPLRIRAGLRAGRAPDATAADAVVAVPAALPAGLLRSRATEAPPGVRQDGPGPEQALLFSAVLPGAGQYLRDQRRWMLYAAAELVGWFLVIDRRREAGRLRDDYRDLAWMVARDGVTEGPRGDGDFDYYEDLSHWERSGAWDRDPQAPGVQPEADSGTFNGSVWELARGLYFPPEGPEPEPGDPTWERAVEYYRERAYGPGFLWDWSGQPASWARFGETIERSDDRFRQATLLTGAVVANHLLSAVDAFVSARLSEAAGQSARLTTRLGARPGRPGAYARLDVTLSLRLQPISRP